MYAVICETTGKVIESEESTEIHKENDVYQFDYESKPRDNSKLRMGNSIIKVKEVLDEEENKVEFLDNRGVPHLWLKK